MLGSLELRLKDKMRDYRDTSQVGYTLLSPGGAWVKDKMRDYRDTSQVGYTPLSRGRLGEGQDEGLQRYLTGRIHSSLQGAPG